MRSVTIIILFISIAQVSAHKIQPGPKFLRQERKDGLPDSNLDKYIVDFSPVADPETGEVTILNMTDCVQFLSEHFRGPQGRKGKLKGFMDIYANRNESQVVVQCVMAFARKWLHYLVRKWLLLYGAKHYLEVHAYKTEADRPDGPRSREPSWGNRTKFIEGKERLYIKYIANMPALPGPLLKWDALREVTDITKPDLPLLPGPRVGEHLDVEEAQRARMLTGWAKRSLKRHVAKSSHHRGRTLGSWNDQNR